MRQLSISWMRAISFTSFSVSLLVTQSESALLVFLLLLKYQRNFHLRKSSTCCYFSLKDLRADIYMVTISQHSGLSSNVTTSKRPLLSTLPKMGNFLSLSILLLGFTSCPSICYHWQIYYADIPLNYLYIYTLPSSTAI